MFHALTVHECAVGAPQITNSEYRSLPADLRVDARDTRVVDDVAGIDAPAERDASTERPAAWRVRQDRRQHAVLRLAVVTRAF